ncbi:MAG: M28 family peptidase, partial [Bacteroidia bacterium]|nr:M28 family peptidase [Bacteroidia bacterium]
LKIVRADKESVYYFGKSFGGNFAVNGSYSGSVIFAGTGTDEIKNADLRGKIIVIIDEQKPGSVTESPWLTARMSESVALFREKGASAVLSIPGPEKQARITAASGFYEYIPTGRLGTLYDSQRTSFETSSSQVATQDRPMLPFTFAEINHNLASDLLGINVDEISGLFSSVRSGRSLVLKEMPETYVRLDVETETYTSKSRNVIAVVEGSDPVLKKEYVVISGHHDGRGIDDGEIVAGADDNGTATVALMEIGQALLAERPKRSVILAWVTGEEQG